ncbi:MAG: CarD family transcriptional regulator, partial [bacterium]
MNLFQILHDSTFPPPTLKELSLKRKVILGKVLEGFFPFLCALFRENWQIPVLVLFSQNDSLEKAYSVLKSLNLPVFRFPALEPYLGEKVASDRTLRAERIFTLWNLRWVKNPVVLTTVKALLQATPPPQFLESFQVFIKRGRKYSWSALLNFLIQTGYQRTVRVGQLGEFSVRGGIIDVFSPSLELPLRLEFSDEELESVRIFDPENQASLEEREEATLLPWRLFEVSEEGLRFLETSFQEQLQALKRAGRKSESRFLEENFNRDFSSLKNGQYFLEEDFYFPYFSQNSYLGEYLSGPKVTISEEIGRIEHSFQEFVKSSEKIYREAVQRGEQVPLKEPFPRWSEFQVKLEENPVIYCTPFNAPLELPLEASPSLPQYSDLSLKLKSWLSQKAVIVFAGKGAKRYRESLESEDIPLIEINSLHQDLPSQGVFIWDLPLVSGFMHSQLKYVFLSDFELFSWKGKSYVEKKYRQAKPVSSLEEIQEGDYVVHQTYGIGIYQGLETLTIDGKSRDYLKIAYAGEDRLFIPVDQIYLIQKYLGDSVKLPPLTKLNTTEWTRIKKRVQESVEKIAQELLQVYAIREVEFPEPYPPFEPWETELAQSFPYEETPDQKQAIQDALS